jgi:opacity protein-like surface antigen
MKTWLLVLFAAAWAAPVEAAVVFLKDGSRLQGTVVGATATDVRLFTGAETLDIEASRIARIDYADAPAPPTPWEHARGSDLLSIDVGLGVPVSGVSITGDAGEPTNNGSVGPLVGVEYLHSLTPWFAVGANFEDIYRSPQNSSDFLPGTNSSISGNTEMLLAVAKLSLTDRGYARPYLLAGLGVDHTSTLIQSTPQAGYAWQDTGTAESRDLVNGGSWGVASTLRLGVDFNVYDPVVFSVEMGWTALGNGRVPSAPAGQALGLSGLSGPLDFFTVAGRWGWRF